MRNCCKSFGVGGSLCKRVTAAILAVCLLCGGVSVFAVDAAKSGKVVKWKLAEESFYGAAEEFKGKKIELGDGIVSVDKERIFGEYIAYIKTWDGATDCIQKEEISMSSSYESYAVVKSSGKVTGNLAQVEDGRAELIKYNWKDPFPLNETVSSELLKLGLSPETTRARYIWMPKYEYGMIEFENIPKGSHYYDWKSAYLIESHGKNSHTGLEVGSLYTLQEIIEDMKAHQDAAYDLEKWNGMVKNYYADPAIFAGRRVTFSDTNIIDFDREYIVEQYTLKIKNRADMLALCKNYQPGLIMGEYVEPTGVFYTFVNAKDENLRDEYTYNGDAAVTLKKDGSIQVGDVGQYGYLNSSSRIHHPDPKSDSIFYWLEQQGFTPEKTRAVSLEFPFFNDFGIFYYDGTHEAFDLINSMPYLDGMIFSSGPYPMETLVQELRKNIEYITPDKNGHYKEILNPDGSRPMIPTGKPVIYLYPEKQTDISVKLHFNGQLATTEPAYGDGWNVTAYPDGRIVNKADGVEYPYLFWDGYSDVDWDFSSGFVVAGTDTEAFLREKLAFLGLTRSEAQEFIDYWLPEMRGNPYNLIMFSEEQYDRLAQIAVTPKPDSILRVHMVYKPLEKPIYVKPQTLTPFERTGFAVVEWGGTRA